MKNLVVILSHCNSEPKLGALRNLISRLKEDDLDVMVMTHISLPKDIQDSVEYMVYDKSNPILKWPEYGKVFWRQVSSKIKILNVMNEHGWTVFNQFKLAGNLGKGLDYTHFTFINYDTVVDENMMGTMKNPSDFVSSEQTSVESWNGDKGMPTLLFNILSKENLKELVFYVSKESYKSQDKCGEGYFETLRKNFNYDVYPHKIKHLNFTFYDQYYSEYEISDNGIHQDFTIFIDDKEENLVVYNINQSFKLNINGIKIMVSQPEIISLKGGNGIESLGYYKENDYIDLLPLYNEFNRLYSTRWVELEGVRV